MRKKICFVATAEMAIETFLLEHIRELAKHCDVTVILNATDPGFLKDARGVRVIPVAIEREIRLWRDCRALTKLISIFRRERFVAVHSIMPKSGLLAMLAGYCAQIPRRTHTFTGQVWATKTGLARWFFKVLDRLLVACATNILVDSESQRAFLVREGIVSERKARVLGRGSIQGVDCKRFRPDFAVRREVRGEFEMSEPEILILFLGRMNVDKGLLDLTRAFVRICEDHDGVRLLFIGPDEQRMQEKILEEAGSLAKRILFKPYTREPEKYMAAADLFCLPSYREGFGSVLIEASAAGVPVAASRIYGVIDAVEDGATGFLFEPRNVEELTAVIRKLIDDSSLRKTMGEYGRQRALRDFSKEAVVAAMLDYYGQIIGRSEREVLSYA